PGERVAKKHHGRGQRGEALPAEQRLEPEERHGDRGDPEAERGSGQEDRTGEAAEPEAQDRRDHDAADDGEAACARRPAGGAGRGIGPVKLPNQKRRIAVTTGPPTTAKLPALASCMVRRPGKSFMATSAGTIPSKTSGKARPPMPMPDGSSAV